ncbi:MAG: AAA family ATPase, partial [Planctomycetes bacterium]|nr:AAA family ATPase [Planctomycetota bacterium]
RAQIPPLFRITPKTGKHFFECPYRAPVTPPSDVTWLWPGRMLNGQLTVIEGAPGEGKSAVAYDLAARVTRGDPFPFVAGVEPEPSGDRQPAKVMMVTEQEGLEGTRAKLQAHGADPEQILWELAIQVATSQQQGLVADRHIELPLDMKILKQEIADQPSIRLLLIDPLCDYCTKPAVVEEMLKELRLTACHFNIPIVVTLPAEVRFDASGNLKVKSRFRTEAARAVWCVATDPKDPDRRLLIPRRTNQLALPPGMAFRVNQQGVHWDESRPIQPRDPLGWEQDIAHRLLNMLQAGPCRASDLWGRILHHGYSQKQVRAVAVRLGIDVRKAPGFGQDGAWEWYLTGAEGNAEADTTAHSATSVVAGTMNSELENEPDGGADREPDTNLQNWNSLEKAAGNANSVVVASAAAERDDKPAKVSPADQSLPEAGTDWVTTPEIATAPALANDTTTNSQNRNSLENTAGIATSVVVTSAAAERNDEPVAVSPADQTLPEDDSDWVTTPVIAPDPMRANDTTLNLQKRNSLANAAGNAESVVVTSAATERDGEPAEVSPADQSLPEAGTDWVAESEIASAPALVNDTTTNSQNQNSLENAAENANSVLMASAATERDAEQSEVPPAAATPTSTNSQNQNSLAEIAAMITSRLVESGFKERAPDVRAESPMDPSPRNVGPSRDREHPVTSPPKPAKPKTPKSTVPESMNEQAAPADFVSAEYGLSIDVLLAAEKARQGAKPTVYSKDDPVLWSPLG